MDIDPNDLLSTNVYISKPDLNPNISIDSNEEFRKYYEKEIQKKSESKIVAAINKIDLHEDEDDNNIINTNTFNNTESGNKETSRFTREVKTLVSIDSRDRIKTLYPKPNNFKIFLGRTFTNVKKIEMVSLEFPNTDAVINTGNNRIYWRNMEDIELDYTVTTNGIIDYPVYNVELRTGSYTSATLQAEIQNKLNSIRRRQGNTSSPSLTPEYHYFVSNLDMDTDVVTLTSLNLKQLPNNPFTTSLSSGVISVLAPSHGYSTNDFIYIVGAKGIAGITSTLLNGFHRITVIGANQFTFEVNVKAGETATAGGNVAKAGTKLPFQLLWGNHTATVAQNIGFPLENSSELIVTNVASLQNIVQMDIILNYDHGYEYNYNYIGNTASVGTLVGGTFITYGSYTITNLFGSTGVRVQVTNEAVINSLINNAQANLFKFDNKTIPVHSYSKYVVQSFLITTFTNHNYNLSDVNKVISLYNTTDPNVDDDVSYDGNYVIQSVPSSTTFILPGVLGPQNTHSTNIYGTLPRKTPLTTWIVKILNVELVTIGIKSYTKITTTEPHKMLAGDKIMVDNLKSTPQIVSDIAIYSVPTSTSLLLDIELNNIDLQNSINPYICTGLITLSYPSHGFNIIVNIQNGTVFNLLDGGGATVPIQPIVITTLNNHNLNIGDTVRLTGTSPTYVNSILTTGVAPSLDGGGYIVRTIESSDTFSIVKVSGTSDSFTPITPSPTITGILGLNNKFILYGVEDVGGISKTMINSNLFTVRDIIDENTFTFIAPNVYATSNETGGGSEVYISSLKHGFNGIQTNTKNGQLTRSINLQGEDYCFLTCPQLDTMLNTGNIKNIFSRISLDQPPGYVCFKYLSNPKHFNTMPLDKLSELEFSIVNYNGSLYDFNDLDFSFTLQITEVTDATKSFNLSSKRGITDSS
jgi:hypothetical protein